MKAVTLTSRGYRSQLREAQARATTERILDAAAALIERRAELTYVALAELAGVQERTVYRHFATKAELEDAFWRRTHARLQPLAEGARDLGSLFALIEQSFREFDRREQLIRSMLHSETGRRIRLAANPERRRRFERVVAAELPQLAAAERRSAAAATQVLSSAMTWECLRDYWGMSGAEASTCVQRAIAALVRGMPPQSTRRTKSAPRPRSKHERAARPRKEPT